MISYDELKKIAALSKLSLDGEDIDALVKDISNILEFADTIARATKAAQANQAATDLPPDPDGTPVWSLRDDVTKASYPVSEILTNAGEQQDGYFVARKRGGLI